MAISGIGQSYYQNNVATTKSTKSVNSTGETGIQRNYQKRKKWRFSKRNFMLKLIRYPEIEL